MCRVICVCNQKGGVGKSATVCNLGVALAREGKKVLLIDADSQGSLSVSLGIRNPDELDISLATVIKKLISDGSVFASDGVLTLGEGVDLMPSNIELAALEVSMINYFDRERVLKEYVDLVKEKNDEDVKKSFIMCFVSVFPDCRNSSCRE